LHVSLGQLIDPDDFWRHSGDGIVLAIDGSPDWEDIDRDSFLAGKIYRVPSAATFCQFQKYLRM